MASPVGRQTARGFATDRVDLVVDAYDRNQADLFGYLTHLTGSGDSAEDLLQDTFLRLVRELRAGRQPIDVRPWLFRVATNAALSRGRHLGVVRRFLGGARRPDVAPAPDDEVLRRETHDEIASALRDLAPDARSAVLLAAQGFSGPEIAGLIGRTPLATRSLLCRGRSALRARLEAEEVRR